MAQLKTDSDDNSNLTFNFGKRKGFSEKLIEIFEQLGKFEKKWLNKNIDGNGFFNEFYELIFNNATGIFALLSRAIDDKLLLHCYNKTYWINYNTHLTPENLPELQRTNLVKADRLINKYFPAYINKDLKNDLSVICYKIFIERPLEEKIDEIFSIHKILVESSEYRSYIHSYTSEKKVYISIDSHQEVYDVGNPDLSKITSLLGLKMEEINDRKLRNYRIFLEHVFEINDKDDQRVEQELRDYREKNIDKKKPFRHFYIYNLSSPYSDYKIGSLMIFSDAQLGEDFNEYMVQIREVINAVKQIEHRYLEKRKLFLLKQNQLKTAIISILIDSYAHNISAHSLAALKWWVELRQKLLDKRFKIPADLRNLLPLIVHAEEQHSQISEQYYDALGLTDSTYNKSYYSLLDLLQFSDDTIINNLFKFSVPVQQKGALDFQPRFPVPIDYALFPFFRFLRDKGAFWSGVTRDAAFGGETKSWYKILWEDFANNPLYLGTIAKSEGITKININLEIKKDGKSTLKGRFVTIDMSVIDYETSIAESPTLEANINQYDPSNSFIREDIEYLNQLENQIEQKNESINNKDKKKEIPFVNSHCYSKYAFIKLGERFAEFREELNKEEDYSVFLPGGIVGEHALFTIFENTIRNIKHYKNEEVLENIRKNGIDFWISIESKPLVGTKPDKNQLFKVGIWLAHTASLESKDNEQGEPKYLLFEITHKSLQPILDETTGTPRMGGNSQDKACAALLFNNKFNSVEDKEKIRDKEYFPWIRFASWYNGCEFESNIKVDTSKEDLEVLKNEYLKKHLSNRKEGYLKKYFYLWRSENLLNIMGNVKIDYENISRFKLALCNKSDEKTIKELIGSGIIRILYDIENKELQFLYKEWLKKLLKINFLDEDVIIGFKSGSEEDNLGKAGAIRVKGGYLSFFAKGARDDFNGAKGILKLSHGAEKDFHCNVRSHGVFLQKFFKNVDIERIGILKINVQEESENKKKANELLLCEFIETILTKIVIFDNRIYNRLSGFSEKKKGAFEEQLYVKIMNEDKNIWENFKKSNNSENNINFLIIHLSFIESLGFKESEMNLFIEKELKNFIKDNFIFVVTSGRGRDEWKDSLKNTNYESFTIFKPIESILDSIENGVSYNDHFDIKYYLIKTLFGS